jgi:serine/threonine protein kinase
MRAAGSFVGRYELYELLGQGGMGQVWRALDTALEREVAVKLLPPETSSPDLRVRFLREARALATVEHPNVVAVYDVGREDGTPFFAMELVRGDSLRSRGWKDLGIRVVLGEARNWLSPNGGTLTSCTVDASLSLPSARLLGTRGNVAAA